MLRRPTPIQSTHIPSTQSVKEDVKTERIPRIPVPLRRPKEQPKTTPSPVHTSSSLHLQTTTEERKSTKSPRTRSPEEKTILPNPTKKIYVSPSQRPSGRRTTTTDRPTANRQLGSTKHGGSVQSRGDRSSTPAALSVLTTLSTFAPLPPTTERLSDVLTQIDEQSRSLSTHGKDNRQILQTASFTQNVPISWIKMINRKLLKFGTSIHLDRIVSGIHVWRIVSTDMKVQDTAGNVRLRCTAQQQFCYSDSECGHGRYCKEDRAIGYGVCTEGSRPPQPQPVPVEPQPQPRPSGQFCYNDPDCGQGQYCDVDQYGEQYCYRPEECPTGFYCDQTGGNGFGICRQGSGGPQPTSYCYSDDDCGSGRLCQPGAGGRGTCVDGVPQPGGQRAPQGCVSDASCRSGEYCVVDPATGAGKCKTNIYGDVPGIDRNPTPESCRTDADCPRGAMCEQRPAAKYCLEQRDCGSGYTCNFHSELGYGECQPGNIRPQPPQPDPSPAPYLAVMGNRLQSCMNDRDCGRGNYCDVSEPTNPFAVGTCRPGQRPTGPGGIKFCTEDHDCGSDHFCEAIINGYGVAGICKRGTRAGPVFYCNRDEDCFDIGVCDIMPGQAYGTCGLPKYCYLNSHCDPGNFCDFIGPGTYGVCRRGPFPTDVSGCAISLSDLRGTGYGTFKECNVYDDCPAYEYCSFDICDQGRRGYCIGRDCYAESDCQQYNARCHMEGDYFKGWCKQ
ncbi:hypothetical protein Bbelb_154110 [Branchiostoma belcheri]|nr:hypothetical protein Bbelb_154110 [Branchiostoma belcheri]